MNNTPHTPELTISLEEITAHLDALASIRMCPQCGLTVSAVMADIGHLLVHVTKLHSALLDARLQAANRLAAIRAALHAQADWEPDPLAYLRDELPGYDDAGRAGGYG